MPVQFHVDPDFYDHPKTAGMSDAAFSLWVRAGSFSVAKLTDGFITEAVLVHTLRSETQVADELVERGLWRRRRGGYVFHQWSPRNLTRQRVEDHKRDDAKRKRAERQKRNGQVRGGGYSDGAESEENLNDQLINYPPNDWEAPANSENPQVSGPNVRSDMGRTPSGVRPESNHGFGYGFDSKTTNQPQDQTHLVGGSGGGDPFEILGTTKPPRKRGSPGRGTRIPPDFSVTQAMVDWAREHTPHVDDRRETEQFIDYWQSKAGRDATKLDWVATWRNSMRRAEERAHHRRSNGHKPTTDDKVSDWQRLKNTTDGATIYALPAGEAS